MLPSPPLIAQSTSGAWANTATSTHARTAAVDTTSLTMSDCMRTVRTQSEIRDQKSEILLSFFALGHFDGLGAVLLQQRQHAGVEEADLEQHQERHGAVDAVGERVEHGGGEVQAQRQLDDRLDADRLVILLADPFVAVAFDAVLGRAGELGLFA